MEIMNNIGIVQNLKKLNNGMIQNEYHFYSGTGYYFGGIIFPADGQYMFDAKILNIVTKAIAMRYGLIVHKPRTRKK